MHQYDDVLSEVFEDVCCALRVTAANMGLAMSVDEDALWDCLMRHLYSTSLSTHRGYTVIR